MTTTRRTSCRTRWCGRCATSAACAAKAPAHRGDSRRHRDVTAGARPRPPAHRARADRATGAAAGSALVPRRRIVKQSQEAWKIEAFVDGELDLASQLEIEDRLPGDPALRR